MRLHQIWFQGADQAPAKYDKNRQTWRRNHPEWKIMTWDQKSIGVLIDEHYPQWRAFYDSLPLMIQKIDIAKVFLAHQHSPCVYADMDSESLRPMDDLMLKSGHSVTVSYVNTMWMEHAAVGLMRGWENGRQINNGIIISMVPKHPFWLYYLERLRAEIETPPRPRTWLEHIGGDGVYVMNTTGPFLWTDSINAYNKKHPGSIRILHYSYLEPLMGMDPEWKKKTFPHSYVMHDHCGSWYRKDPFLTSLMHGYYRGIRPYWELWGVLLLVVLVGMVYWAFV